MLRRKAGPLLHSGYALPPFQHAVDLAWFRMDPAGALAYDSGLLQRIDDANLRLFGDLLLTSRPQRLLLLQSLVDLWCCDWDAVKLSFSAPVAQQQAAVAATTAAVFSSLLSAAQMAHALGSGNDAAVSSAAAAATALAGSAMNHVQQLQQITALAAADAGGGSSSGQVLMEVHTGGPTAAAGLSAGPSAGVGVGQQQQQAAGGVGTRAAVPLLGGMGGPCLMPVAVSAPFNSSQAAPAAAETLQATAEEAAEWAQQLGKAAAPSMQVLARGAGLLVLLDGEWGGKARQLGSGRAVVGGQEYSHFSVLQLMTPDGLLLREGHSQQVQIRVAAEFLSAGRPLTGHWSKAQHSISITPGRDLLLSCQPKHIWGQRFTAGCPAAASSYLALYDTLSDVSVEAVLGGLTYVPHPIQPATAAVVDAPGASMAVLSMQDQGGGVCQAPAAPSSSTVAEAVPADSSVQGLLQAALTAINELLGSSSEAGVDAAYAAAVSAVTGLARATRGSGSAVMQGLMELYMAVAGGSAAPVGTLQQVFAGLRRMAAAEQQAPAAAAAVEQQQAQGGIIDAGAQCTTVYPCKYCGQHVTSSSDTRGAMCKGSCQKWIHWLESTCRGGGAAAAAGSAGRGSRERLRTICRACCIERDAGADDGGNNNSSSDDSEGAAAGRGSSRKRGRPSWADDRPGCWLAGAGASDFFVQHGDFVIMQAAAEEPLAFVVGSSGGAGAAHVSLCKIVGISRQQLTLSRFFNSQRSLSGPLQYQQGVRQALARSSMNGRVLYALEPECPDEVLMQLDSSVVRSVQESMSALG